MSPYSYAWNFGDGATASGTATPSHTYADNGSYTATLTVTDATGQTVHRTAVATVANVAPTAPVTAPTTATVGTPVSFTDPATDPSPVDTAAGFTYAWNFGDGTTGTGEAPSHTYASAGTYTVTVTATDKDGGESGARTATITISTPSDPPGPVIPQHYSWVRTAELAYYGNPMGSFEDNLLANSVDLVVPNAAFLQHIASVSPSTPRLIYTNTTNLYQNLLLQCGCSMPIPTT